MRVKYPKPPSGGIRQLTNNLYKGVTPMYPINVPTERSATLTITIKVGYRDSIQDNGSIDYQWYVMFGAEELLCANEDDAITLRNNLISFIRNDYNLDN